MALTRAKKTEKVGQLASELEHSTSAIIGTFAGLTAAKDFDLRKTIREAGGSYHVVKNKLAARAARGHQDRGRAAGPQGRLVGCLHLGRSGRAGQGALHLGQGQRGVHLQARHRRRQGHHRRRDQGARHPAGQGRALLEAALPHPVARAASGHGHQRHRPRSRRRHQPGRREGQVCRPGSRSALPKLPAAKLQSQKQPAAVAEAPVAEAAAPRSPKPLTSKRPPQASSLRAQRSRRTPPHRRLAKPPPPIRSKAHNKFRFISTGCASLGATETRRDRGSRSRSQASETQISSTHHKF